MRYASWCAKGIYPRPKSRETEIGFSITFTELLIHPNTNPAPPIDFFYSMIMSFLFFILGFPSGSVVKNLPAKQETWV